MRLVGREFKPKEPYTHRIRKILEEYPDGSQVLREILQNSDDARSTEQIFILDHNTYSSDKLFEPHLDNYRRDKKSDLKLDRYQGPALLAINNTIFEERDFQSLLKLADSEKYDQFDKIGVMGVGFNSIYHITDSPSFITDDKYVILDPHEWYFNGGVQFDFVDEELARDYPDQFAPFRVPCDKPLKGTIFRYPLRTKEDSTDSDISKKIYKPEEILDMFHKFYDSEGINCLLFLKYIENISFFELKKGAAEPELLYKIKLDNADQVRHHRRLIVENIMSMMNSLNSGELDTDNQLETSYVASFSRQKGPTIESNSEWLILNYLDNLLKAEKYFQEKFGKNIADYKFIPNVGLAVPLNDLNITGRLFCFLPLPISMPFLVSVHGYFAVSTNRRSLWSTADNEYLATDGLARLKIAWNLYLFEKVLPKAWIKFLRELTFPNIQSDDLYKFWPIVKEGEPGSINSFCKNLLQNVIENLDIKDCVFKGSPSSNEIKPWLSLYNDYLDDKFLHVDLLNIIGNIGISVISTLYPIIKALKNSRHKDLLRLLSPAIIRTYLKRNRARWEDAISRDETLQLFKYILEDPNFDELEGLKMIPLADGTLGILTQSNDSFVYIDDITNHRNNESNVFKNQLNTNKLIDRSIDLVLYRRLYDNAKAGWNLNIKILDEIGIKDLSLIIQNMIEGNNDRNLSIDEINNVVEILERIAKIQKDAKRKGNDPERLDGLLIPSTKNTLVRLQDIHFDDMEDRLDDKEKSKYEIAHHHVTLYIAKELEIQTLTGKIYGINYTRDIDWEIYEQNESLTTRIKNIIKDYSLGQLFREFLQNADDAKATCFTVIIDQRNHVNSKKYLLSEEMEGWQGPAIWIYNDAEFSNDDFQALIKLGIGGKSHEDENENNTKIGRFGVGFNCAFHITDLPSIVSGKYIVFLDPHAEYLPVIEYPPRRRKGVRINFIEKDFKRSFPDQCYPYEAFDCDFTKEFKGTLFRLPLRTHKLAEKSKILNRVPEINEILKLFNSIQDNNEMLFLRNIESCRLYNMEEQNLQLMWQAKINMSDICRNSRRNITSTHQVYQMDIEITDNNVNNTTISEIWLLCTGGHDKIADQELEKFSKEKRLKPRGGVASLLARSRQKSTDELKAGSFPDPPALKGEIFSYLPLSITTNLGIHLSGNFTLSSARNSILQSDKWNLYILNDVLPDLHIKLLEEIVNLEKARHMKERATNFTPHTLNNLWPIKNFNVNKMYRNYCSRVMKKLDQGNHQVFWTDSNGGRFVSIKEGRILEEDDEGITDILANLGIPVLRLNKVKLDQIRENCITYPISGKLVCQELQAKRDSIPWDKIYHSNGDNVHDSIFKLLNLILKDKSNFGILTGLPLVPLNNGSVGRFCEQVYYVGKRKNLELFPKTHLSKFITVNLPENLSKIFKDNTFSAYTSIKKFDASAILDLLICVLPCVDELKWKPDGYIIPNSNWLKNIWAKLNKSAENIDFTRLSNFPLLPMIEPSKMLVRPNMTNPLLCKPESGHTLFSLYSTFVKLKLRFTDIILPDNSHANLKKCVVKCTLINIINSLESTRLSLNLTMVQLFEIGKLSAKEFKKLRNLIKKDIDILIKHGSSQTTFKEILRSLPIWTIQSSSKSIDAKSGILLPTKIPCFPFRENVYFYNESVRSVLNKLGTTHINELAYVEDYMIPYLEDFQRPSQAYVNFLKNLLSLENQGIERRLKSCKAIPNRSLATFARAEDLYDSSVPIFSNVLSDKFFLPLKLQSSSYVCLEALERMDFNRKMNANAYIKCAREIESQIQQKVVVRDKAKILVLYLYQNINTLNFNDEQWKEVLEIKFVPSNMNLMNLSSQFYKSPKETFGFEPFKDLCFNKYRNVCWTQCPFFDASVEPTVRFNNTEIGFPSTENIIKHWFYIVENLSSWRSSGKDEELKRVIEEIYKNLNMRRGNFNVAIGNKKLFLNGEDLFDERSWVAGEDLVLGLQDIDEGMHTVKKFLMPHENLLMIAGARKLNKSRVPEIEPYDQKDVLFDSLLNKLVNQSDSKYHDVIFIVGEERTRIGANKYVLSAVSTYFERVFETESVIEVPEDIKLETFRVFLQWLYGQSFKNSVLRRPEDHLSFLLNLLKVANLYEAEPLKDKVENLIMRGQYIGISNLYKILVCSEEYNAKQLRNYYEDHIRSNKEIVEEELRKNTVNDDERLKISPLLYRKIIFVSSGYISEQKAIK